MSFTTKHERALNKPGERKYAEHLAKVLPRETAQAFAAAPITDKDVRRVMRHAATLLLRTRAPHDYKNFQRDWPELFPAQELPPRSTAVIATLTNYMTQRFYDNIGFDEKAVAKRTGYMTSLGGGNGNGYTEHKPLNISWGQLYALAGNRLNSSEMGGAVRQAMENLDFLGKHMPEDKTTYTLQRLSLEASRIEDKYYELGKSKGADDVTGERSEHILETMRRRHARELILEIEQAGANTPKGTLLRQQLRVLLADPVRPPQVQNRSTLSDETVSKLFNGEVEQLAAHETRRQYGQLYSEADESTKQVMREGAEANQQQAMEAVDQRQLLRVTGDLARHLRHLNDHSHRSMYSEAYAKNPGRAKHFDLGKRAFVASRILIGYNIAAEIPENPALNDRELLKGARLVAQAAESIVALKPWGPNIEKEKFPFEAGKAIGRITRETGEMLGIQSSQGR